MNHLSKLLIMVSVASQIGCGNGAMKEINPNGGTITLYAANGTVIRQFEADGKPQMYQGGHLFCREKSTNKLIIVYGTYTFVEADDKPK